MNDKAFALTACFDDFLKAATVNLYTGEYRFVKSIELEEKLGCMKAPTIEGYIKNVLANGIVHADDATSYLHHTELEYLRRRITENKRKMVHSFRRRAGDVYIWVTFEITVPKNFSEEKPWVLFSWKESDSDSTALEDALRMLSSIFHKILKVNLTTDSYEAVKVYEEEMTQQCGLSPKLSEWLRDFAETGYVFGADRDNYLNFTDLDSLRSYFKQSKDCIRCRYRRKMGDSFRWVSMELLPSIEYTDDDQVVMLYIRDIHDDYISELNYQRELEYYCNYDILTGIWNRYYYKNYCAAYDRNTCKSPMGVLFADINGLKYVNDTYGHIQGDEYIKKFSVLLTGTFGARSCCRISGDEFVVFLEHMEREQAAQYAAQFHARLQQDEYPIASIGFAWSEDADTIEALIRDAETAMYSDKQNFYQKHPKHAR